MFFLFACTIGINDQSSQKSEDSNSEIVDVERDIDADGYTTADDCDDYNADIFPNQFEVCDGIDNNCNEEIDEGVLNLYYKDDDGDGYGNADDLTSACHLPLGYVQSASDCDDADPEISPTAPEICDGIDNNCNGVLDSNDEFLDVNTAFYFYADLDQDGFGDIFSAGYFCEAPPYYISTGGDCDDANPMVFPGNDEVCDDIDNDCNQLIDEEDSNLVGEENQFLWLDSDGDGFGDQQNRIISCQDEEGYVSNSFDCDDSTSITFPQAQEICDGEDNNCDFRIDEYENLAQGIGNIFYLDQDLDGYGSKESVLSCDLQFGLSENDLDCDDSNSNTFPGSAEQESIEKCLQDSDGDGYSPTELGGEDCDDSNIYINPFAYDIYGDFEDINCDGTDGMDLDADGYASLASGGSDCDDENPTINGQDLDGDGQSTCDGDCDDYNVYLHNYDLDGDGFSTCDGDCDDNLSTRFPNEDILEEGISDSANICFSDLDGDGFAPLAEGGTDCDDNNPYVFPGSAEMESDTLCLLDADGDGFAPFDWGGSDCNDSYLLYNPLMTDFWGDGIDHDCDGGDGIDLDSDGFATYLSGGNDCDDSDPDYAFTCPPTFVSLELSQYTGQTGDIVTCTVEFEEWEGNTVTVSYSFDDGNVFSEENTIVLTEYGAQFSCCVELTDSNHTVVECSEPVSVENSLPQFDSVEFTQDTYYVDDTITVDVEVFDADEHELAVLYHWSISRESQTFLHTTESPNLSNEYEDIFGKGDEISVLVEAYDGYGLTTMNTSSVVINNSLPEISQNQILGQSVSDIEITTESPYAELHHLKCALMSEPIDADGDEIMISYQWKRDGLWVDELSDTIDVQSILPNEIWTCEVVLSDGENIVVYENSVEILSPYCDGMQQEQCGDEIRDSVWSFRPYSGSCANDTIPIIISDKYALDSNTDCSYATNLASSASLMTTTFYPETMVCDSIDEYFVRVRAKINTSYKRGFRLGLQWGSGEKIIANRWVWSNEIDSALDVEMDGFSEQPILSSSSATTGTSTLSRPFGSNIGMDTQWFDLELHAKPQEQIVEISLHHPTVNTVVFTAEYQVQIPQDLVPNVVIEGWGLCSDFVSVDAEILQLNYEPNLWKISP